MEELRNVPGFNGKYQIDISTKEGRCRSLFNNHGRPRKEPHYLSNKHNARHTYISWQLYKDGHKINYQAARWIAITFPELVQNKYFEGAEIDHIDGDRLNNHPSNLRWVTKKENQNNPVTKVNMGKAQRNRPDQSKEVQQYTKEGDLVAEYPSAGEASRKTGISVTNISACCIGRTYTDKNGYTHTWRTIGGYVWKYKG